MREVLFDAVLTGVRRVMCCRRCPALTPRVDLEGAGVMRTVVWEDWIGRPLVEDMWATVARYVDISDRVFLVAVPHVLPLGSRGGDPREVQLKWAFVHRGSFQGLSLAV